MGSFRRSYLLVRALSAGVLVGAALWITWHTARYWLPCEGSAWDDMNDACGEAMSGFNPMPLLGVWGALFAVVAVLALTGLAGSASTRILAIVVCLIACPLVDPGIFWVEWGSADGIPGQGLWTACGLPLTALIIAFTRPSVRDAGDDATRRTVRVRPTPLDVES